MSKHTYKFEYKKYSRQALTKSKKLSHKKQEQELKPQQKHKTPNMNTQQQPNKRRIMSRIPQSTNPKAIPPQDTNGANT